MWQLAAGHALALRVAVVPRGAISARRARGQARSVGERTAVRLAGLLGAIRRDADVRRLVASKDRPLSANALGANSAFIIARGAVGVERASRSAIALTGLSAGLDVVDL